MTSLGVGASANPATWTGTVQGSPLVPAQGQLITTVTLSDGIHPPFDVDVANDGSVANLTQNVQNLITARDATSGQRLPVPQGTILNLVPVIQTPPQPTPEQNYMGAYLHWRHVQRAVTDGMTGLAQSDADTAKSNAAGLWQPAFVDALPID